MAGVSAGNSKRSLPLAFCVWITRQIVVGKSWGSRLYQRQRTVGAGDRTPSDQSSDHYRETFYRRLAEAQAFGEASDGLSSRRPEFSARGGLTVAQRLFGWMVVFGFVAAMLSAPRLTLDVCVAALGLIFLGLISLRFFAAVLKLASGKTASAPAPASISLPVITLLIPLYKEAAVLPDLVAAIAALDYPRDRLDVKLLIEADDRETLGAIEALGAQDRFEVIPVPPGPPRTKPKALNYGLHFARGDLVTIFDAEDRPHPSQPRAAAAAFMAGGKRLAVVQAPLSIHNGGDGWFARQFEIEYAIHFRVWLPMLAWLRAPLALGGTSNYFRRDVLKEAGGWDAWNVTEDADIGLRLARMGYRAGMIAPATEEEATNGFKPWLNQRTRWMKGYLQTWLVLNRAPIKVARGMGLVNFLLTQLTLGGALLAAMVHGPLLLWILANAVMLSGFEAWHIALFGLGYGSALAAALASGAGASRPMTLLTLPLYWPLQSVAVIRAFYEMQRKPFYWAKTAHGAGRPAPAASPVALQDDNVVQLPLPFD